ncbi:Sulfotransferase family cytosolic 2B member 1 [Nymphon striatum]|nr:Sulfotransferase family cytosolic 2B member 1 [Nymphon striatum]
MMQSCCIFLCRGRQFRKSSIPTSILCDSELWNFFFQCEFGFIFQIKSPFYTTIHGLEHCPVAAGYADLNLFRSGLEYAPRDSDIFIVSYPKSGTTWMQMIVWLLLNDLEPPKYIDQLTDDNFLEYFAGKEGVSKMKEPRQIKSHLPFDLIPFNPKAKYIHVCRNPFDVCVSLYKHTYGFKKYYFDGSMDEFFEYFHKGETYGFIKSFPKSVNWLQKIITQNIVSKTVEFGDYYSHLSSWYEQSHPNILFVTFEEMKENIKGVVENIVKFIGGEIEARASQDGFIDKLVKMSKFSEMQKLPQKEIMKEGQAFVSQGKAGNFSNALNKDQCNRLLEKYKRCLKEDKLINLWKPYVEIRSTGK